MEHKPKIIIIFGFIIALIMVISGSNFTKQFWIITRKDYIDNNIFVYYYNNDINYFQKIEPQNRVNNVYVDNNNKMIDSNSITSELKLIPTPIIIQNIINESIVEDNTNYDTVTNTNH